MSIGTIVFLTFIITIAIILLGESAITWILRKVVWRGIQSTVVDKSDAEALFGRWHKGWRVWALRFSALVIIVALLWVIIPRPRTAAKWFGNEVVDRAIDKTVDAADQRVPGAAAHSEKIRQGLRSGAERAYNKVKSK